MSSKATSRKRRARRTRAHIRKAGAVRLTVHRTPRHIYAQLITPEGDRTLAVASSLDADVRKAHKATGNVETATAVGKLIAERAKDAGIDTVAFDRSGYRYHGRIQALADAAREGGLKF